MLGLILPPLQRLGFGAASAAVPCLWEMGMGRDSPGLPALQADAAHPESLLEGKYRAKAESQVPTSRDV